MRKCLYNFRLHNILPLVLLLLFFLILTPEAFPAQIDKTLARKAAKVWLRGDHSRFGLARSAQIQSVVGLADANGLTRYYVADLNQTGFVVLSADDCAEPLICFSPSGRFTPDKQNPLFDLIEADIPNRAKAAIANRLPAATDNSTAENHAKWARLIAYDTNNVVESVPSVSDLRVAPIIQSRWNQTTVCSQACYNYYTPPYDAGDPANYPSGCVATAMAQLIRFHNVPDFGIGTIEYQIEVEGVPQAAVTRGGDGLGGSYSYAFMPLVPGCSTTLAERQAIASLCYDAGLTVGMDYALAGSGAFMFQVTEALESVFGYSNAVDAWNGNDDLGPALVEILNPNLDACLPVILAITGSSGSGHAVLADGYGFIDGTLYHHLNMGWSGSQDVWYSLPNIDSIPSYDTVVDAIYNIYTSGTGEIISGRVTDANGLLLQGAVVTAVTVDASFQTLTTDTGIYALPAVPSNTEFALSVAKPGYQFTDCNVVTGFSQDDRQYSGNRWAVDFVGTWLGQSPPVAVSMQIEVVRGAFAAVNLLATDDGLPDPPATLEYIVMSLPDHGSLTDPCAAEVTAVPYTLADNGDTVIYTPLPCYTGHDQTTFIADDSGSEPDGGTSNIAAIDFNVAPGLFTLLHADFEQGLPAGWSVIDGGAGDDTWTFDNPANRTSDFWTGSFMIADSDYAGHKDMDEQLITPPLDCSGLVNIVLEFAHDYKAWRNDIADVDIRINGGDWLNIESFEIADAAGVVSLDLSAFGADDASSLEIRWHYVANFDFYWGIDHVSVTASQPLQIASPADFQKDCIVDYLDLQTLAWSWLASSADSTYNPACDIAVPHDDFVDAADFAGLAADWLSHAR